MKKLCSILLLLMLVTPIASEPTLEEILMATDLYQKAVSDFETAMGLFDDANRIMQIVDEGGDVSLEEIDRSSEDFSQASEIFAEAMDDFAEANRILAFLEPQEEVITPETTYTQPSGVETTTYDSGDKYLVHSVYYYFDKYELIEDERQNIEIVLISFGDPSSVRYHIEGHTCDMGFDYYNQILSLRRAVEVKHYLMSLGINEKDIGVKGHSRSRPIASNDTEEGRTLNRRVEIYIY